MEPYLTITQINDFIFCPYSLYFSGIFRSTVSDSVYHETPQRIGQSVHQRIDRQTYSSRKSILAGTTVYCSKYNLLGKIDIFDITTGVLTERKYSVTAIYDGFCYQLYAQLFALTEMGYHVKALRIHAIKDNRIHKVPMPSTDDIDCFEHTLECIRNFSTDRTIAPNPNKCRRCVYRALCNICPIEVLENDDLA